MTDRQCRNHSTASKALLTPNKVGSGNKKRGPFSGRSTAVLELTFQPVPVWLGPSDQD